MMRAETRSGNVATMVKPRRPVTRRALEDDPDEWPASEHAIFFPPWTDGGLLYGPANASQYDRALHDHRSVRFGAIDSDALYDESQEHPRRVRPSTVERKDAVLFERKIPVLRVAMPQRELQAAMYFWVSRASFGVIARRMNVTRATVRTWITRTRKRLNGE